MPFPAHNLLSWLPVLHSPFIYQQHKIGLKAVAHNYTSTTINAAITQKKSSSLLMMLHTHVHRKTKSKLPHFHLLPPSHPLYISAPYIVSNITCPFLHMIFCPDFLCCSLPSYTNSTKYVQRPLPATTHPQPSTPQLLPPTFTSLQSISTPPLPSTQ